MNADTDKNSKDAFTREIISSGVSRNSASIKSATVSNGTIIWHHLILVSTSSTNAAVGVR